MLFTAEPTSDTRAKTTGFERPLKRLPQKYKENEMSPTNGPLARSQESSKHAAARKVLNGPKIKEAYRLMTKESW